MPNPDETLTQWKQSIDAMTEAVQAAEPNRVSGRLVRASGLLMECIGLQLPIGSGCLVEMPSEAGETVIEAEVVGFSGDRLYLMSLEHVEGVMQGAHVYPHVRPGSQSLEARMYPVGDGLLGRIVDGLGHPLDGKGELADLPHRTLSTASINPLDRAPISRPMDVGIRSINSLLTIGRGQRIGLFAGSGVGKSVLLGMMARFTEADVIVVGLIGERGREVQEFIQTILGEQGLVRSVVVAAPADNSPLQRMHGATYATLIAEHFRDQGKHVLLIMDSLTRYAMAQREIALAVGEPPATKGYPSSVFARIPTLVERTGNGPEGGGSITAFYTVLTEGDDQQDPVADAARAILDGHIVLSRELAEAGHYPAVDVEASISRVMPSVVDQGHIEHANALKHLFSLYHRNRDLISVGAYQTGNDPMLDRAVQLYPQIAQFLQQRTDEQVSFEQAHQGLVGSLLG